MVLPPVWCVQRPWLQIPRTHREDDESLHRNDVKPLSSEVTHSDSRHLCLVSSQSCLINSGKH